MSTKKREDTFSFIAVAGASDWTVRETQITELCLECKLCPRLNVLPDTVLRSDLSGRGRAAFVRDFKAGTFVSVCRVH